MADLSSNSPPEDGEIVFDTPKESAVDGMDEQTPKTANNRRHQRSTSSSSTKATRVDPLALQVKLVLIQSDRVASKSYLLRLNTKMMPNTRDSTRAQKPAKNLS